MMISLEEKTLECILFSLKFGGIFVFGLFIGIIGVEINRKLHQTIIILFIIVFILTLLTFLFPMDILFLFFTYSFFIGYLLGRVLKLSILQYRYFKLIEDIEIKKEKKVLMQKILKFPVRGFSGLALFSILYVFLVIGFYYHITEPYKGKPIIVDYIFIFLVIVVLIYCVQGIYKVLKISVENEKNLTYYNKKYSLEEKNYIFYFFLTLFPIFLLIYFNMMTIVEDTMIANIICSGGFFIFGVATGIAMVETDRKLNWTMIISFFVTVLLTFLSHIDVFIFILFFYPFFTGYLPGRFLKLSILQYRYFKLMEDIGIKQEKKVLIQKILKSPVRTLSVLVLSSILYIFFIITIHYYYIKNPQVDKTTLVLGLGCILIILIYLGSSKNP